MIKEREVEGRQKVSLAREQVRKAQACMLYCAWSVWHLMDEQ
jgi:hypothetical protein